MSMKLQVSANLIVGSDGSTSKNGSSIGLSNPIDRARFHQLRSKCDLILIGGETARREPYKKTPVPLFIITHSQVKLQPKNQLAKQINLPPQLALVEIERSFPEKSEIHILVEAGPKLLQQMIDLNLIDTFYLTINHTQIGEQKIDYLKMLTGFSLIESSKDLDTELQTYKLTNR